MTATKKVMLSAVQPTNQLHLGNYLGAIKNWVDLQDKFDCIFFAVDLHAITVRQDPKLLKENSYRAIATYIASGIDPNKSILFAQSHVAEHAELAWILTCFTGMGELGRMTQYKDKSSKQNDSISAGLFTYPALMAADILLYQTHLVPVGEDQKQHLELARDLAERVNKFVKKDIFVIPDVYTPPVGARVMSLQNPESKMSKSDPDPQATIFLTDTDDQILKKFKRAVTDSEPAIKDKDVAPGVQSLFAIQSAVTGKSVASIHTEYVGKQYGHLKVETAEKVIARIAPIRKKTEELLSDVHSIDQIMRKGAEAARTRAEKTLHSVYEAIGFIPK